MNFEEHPITFCCGGSSLLGILSIPEQASSRGVLIVVGGPQYRAGSHRQFVLLARYLAADGVPVMRFDYRGMGDSEGSSRTFEEVNEDLRVAIDQFFAKVSGLREVVIWGLCDAASAAVLYAHRDPRVHGLVLLNPWVRTSDGVAKAYLKHYYGKRLFEREFWSKVLSGRFAYPSAARSLASLAAQVLRSKRNGRPSIPGTAAEEQDGSSTSLPDRVLDSLQKFRGRLLVILSGDDLTAQEFSETVSSSIKWQRIMASSRTEQRNLPQANHTFSRRDWRDRTAYWTKLWIKSW
jgi:exosortase A-associated hydrolase 1